MPARRRSAKPPSSGSRRGTQPAIVLLGRGRSEPRPPRLDRPQPLAQARPGPGLDLAVADRRLAPRRLQILEPGVRLLDHQQLFRLSLRRHVITPGVAHDARTLGPPPDGVRRRGGTAWFPHEPPPSLVRSVPR